MTRKMFLAALFAPLARFAPNPQLARPMLIHNKIPQFIQDMISQRRLNRFELAVEGLRKTMGTYDPSLGSRRS